MGNSSVIILIPAYNPGVRLKNLAVRLSQSELTEKVIIVDDGSSKESEPVFESIKDIEKVLLLRHETNKGKGAALKSGLEHIYDNFPEIPGVVTADADEQHCVEDIQKTASALLSNSSSLIMGVRQFDSDVPFRSMLGNSLTRLILKMLFNFNITDTQTGLRGIPRHIIPLLLKIPYNRYEYEMKMLLMCRDAKVDIMEITIETIYLEGNAASHFNPLKDSIKIYSALFLHLLFPSR